LFVAATYSICLFLINDTWTQQNTKHTHTHTHIHKSHNDKQPHPTQPNYFFNKKIGCHHKYTIINIHFIHIIIIQHSRIINLLLLLLLLLLYQHTFTYIKELNLTQLLQMATKLII
jgi:hypothetical protein